MAERETIDVTMSTIAILAPPPKDAVPLDQQGLAKVLKKPFMIGQGPEGLVIVSQRDQIEVVTGGNKTNVRDLSGDKDFSGSKIPKVLHFFTELFGSVISSYGINFQLTLPCKASDQWMASSVFAERIADATDQQLIGGSAVIRTKHQQKVWNVKLEPAGDMMSVDLNAAEDLLELPQQDRLLQELDEQFNSLIEFLSRLGL